MPLVTSYLRECGVSTSQQQAVIEEARVALLAGSPLGFCLCKRCFQPLSSEGKVVSRVHCPRCNVRTLAATESVVSPLAPLRPYLTTHGELGVAPCTLMPVFQGDGSVPMRKCSVCASGVGSAGGMRCWRGSKYYHYRCLGMARVSRGPWVCPSCRERSIALGEKDIVLDEHLMQTVVTREAPAVWPLLEVERCVRAARWLKWSRGALWVCDDVYGERRIPPLWEREALVRYTAMQLGFPHGSRVYCLLRQRYYWANLRRDCIRICATAIAV